MSPSRLRRAALPCYSVILSPFWLEIDLWLKKEELVAGVCECRCFCSLCSPKVSPNGPSPWLLSSPRSSLAPIIFFCGSRSTWPGFCPFISNYYILKPRIMHISRINLKPMVSMVGVTYLVWERLSWWDILHIPCLISVNLDDKSRTGDRFSLSQKCMTGHLELLQLSLFKSTAS